MNRSSGNLILASENSTLWLPGKTTGFAVYPVTTRAQDIAKSREELIGLLRDVPESDYELSLTDLVEKKLAVDSSVIDKTQSEENKVRLPVLRSAKMKNRSSSDGVLLNMFVPSSLGRSLTGSRRRTTTDRNKREREGAMPGCWSVLWEKSRGKSRRWGQAEAKTVD